ncbi:LacI family transcriptional regulator [Cryobacterium breve]|uniref:LacI family transcriptional regulator n=1 Tax=Cryobacterium breve TaxID=1259258 RepID=A0ABY7NI14_9MICO|nr:LacI family DNA-binding transcriptional regulator [Cryobacterium breve]WBM81230.1 LacI family transcriptional regulator [Cryobacterium breve]
MASIHDVARVAGVSISTVSYALSGKRSIAASTRLRVLDAVERLGYRPNAGARMLAGTRTNIFALTAPFHADTYAPAHMAFVLAVAQAAREHDYDVLLLTQDEATSGLRRVASSSLVDGIIVLDVAGDDDRVAVIRELGVPATFIGIPKDAAGLVCVDLDFEAAAALAVEKLVAAGHRSIGLIGHSPGVYARGSNFPPRFRDGFFAAAAAHGIETAFVMPERDGPSVRIALDALFAERPEMTAVVLHAEESIHAAVLDVLRERGLRVPQDLSVLAACASFETDHFEPPLDTIPLVAADSCWRAVTLAIEQVSGPIEPRIELVPPRFYERGSIAPPPDRHLASPRS